MTEPVGGLETFTGRLRAAMALAGMGNNALERAIKTRSRGYITQVLTRRTVPGPEICERIAEALNVHYQWLTLGKGPMMLAEQTPAAEDLAARVQRLEEKLATPTPRRRPPSGANLRAVGHPSDRPPSDPPPRPSRK